ncbi:MAG: sporulation integral membrane protein YlbJ [Desulfotomaculum sp.]|nr:sporulation integral membrane protein YlbJ [Desulfotomaculum sp.]
MTLIILFICAAAIFRLNLERYLRDFRISFSKLLCSAFVIFFVFSMITQPKIVFEGASVGLKAWWEIVFPSLLPFFIASELLMNLGIVHFMGVLLEPIMRPVFNVPGCGSFVMVVGFTSGCPIGSLVTANLRRSGMCTRVEAERLMSFTNNSSPLFMLVAVSVGMFGNPKLGVLIAGTHYLANLTLGLLLRFYKKGDQERTGYENKGQILTRALKELSRIHREENRPLGKLMGDAIGSSITTLLKIGGFMILFAVIIRLLTHAGFINAMASIFAFLLSPLGLEPEIYNAIASGIFEITLGAKLASETPAPLLQQLIAVSVILAWSGLSIHAQVASLIADTDIRIYPFIMARFAHACLAGTYTYLFWKYYDPAAAGWSNIPTLAPGTAEISWWSYNLNTFKIFLIIMAILILAGLLYQLMLTVLKKLRNLTN